MKKVVFNLDEYADRNVVMHCPEKWQAELFCQFLHDNGRQWCDGDSYEKTIEWDYHRGKTCYDFNEGTRDSLVLCKENDATILEIADFIIDEPETKPVTVLIDGISYTYDLPVNIVADIQQRDTHSKAIDLIQKQIDKHRHNLRHGIVQPADVDRVSEKVRLLEYIMRVLKNEK